MFQPLAVEEVAAAAGVGAGADKVKPRPIVPVPEDAPDMNYWHREHGEPSRAWPYHDAGGQVVGYVLRWDFTGNDGTSDKDIRPVCYCDLGNGQRAWRPAGMPAPRPLYRLPDVLSRPDARVLVVEGEKAADAAARLFEGLYITEDSLVKTKNSVKTTENAVTDSNSGMVPELVATTPPHGALAPHKADWTPLKGRHVVVWPDHDKSGAEYAEAVARLCTDSGAASVAIVPVPPDFPPKWDVADALPEGWTVERLRELLDAARPVEPGEPEHKETPRRRRDWPFRLKPHGVFKRHEDSEGTVEWRPVCSPLDVVAETRNEHGEDWGRLLVVTDRDDNRHEWAMPMEMLAGSGEEYRRRLLSMGLRIAPGPFAKRALHEYVSEAQPDAKARCVSRVGWHATAGGNVFVLPGESYGVTNGERVLLQSASSNAHHFRTAGGLNEWQEGIGRLCVGNSRLVFAVSTAFAGPLLYLANEQSGGIHFVGQSQSGKTTVVRAAGTVWGGGSLNGFLRTWRATSNGLEGTAAEHCDTLLCLDEMGQVDAREAGEVAYMLANGSGKARSRRDGTARPPAEWRLLFLSTGEVSLADKMAEGGKRPKAGQEVRLADVPADAGAGLGIFEELHDFQSPDALARHLCETSERYYGSPARAFLNQLVQISPEALSESVRRACTDFMAKHVPEGASGQVLSVAGRFAVIAAAGTLATAFGILPWPEEEADTAAGICFKAWLAKRGGAGAMEFETGLAQIRHFLEAHGNSRFQAFGKGDEGDETRVIDRAGFRRKDDDGRWEYFVLPEAWKAELCAGQDPRALAKELLRRGFLVPGSDGKPQSTHKLPGMGAKRCYHLSAQIVSDGGSGV